MGKEQAVVLHLHLQKVKIPGSNILYKFAHTGMLQIPALYWHYKLFILKIHVTVHFVTISR
jgi:hypothetical protein